MPDIRGLRWIRNFDQITSKFRLSGLQYSLYSRQDIFGIPKASRHQCNMSAELRKSAGSDIKRLQEMVKRLEEQNAQLKNTDNRRTPNRVIGEDNMVKVKLNLDDVPLLDLNAMVEEDEDTWLVNRKGFFGPSCLLSVLELAPFNFSVPSNSNRA